MKEMLKRAGRTFFQTVIGYITANLAFNTEGITDGGMLKTALIGLLISSIAAGLAAVMNMPKPIQDENSSEDDDER